MNNSPKAIGEQSEGMILAALLRAGEVVLQPFGDNQRYDLVVDRNGTFVRIQCKTGRVKDGAVIFHTCSMHYHRGKGKQSYHHQADLFGVYVPELDRSFLVPVEDVPSRMGTLRLEPPKNGQVKGIRMAAKYEFQAGVAQR